MTEEDLRTKIIYEWLRDLEFKNDQIHLEYSFKINLGKYTYKVNSSSESNQEVAYPRTDILVKDNQNKNLLIIEVKKPDHKLKDNDKDQAISYARLLPQIAPFTILTNGLETIIYDSITGEALEEQYISNLHTYIKNDFKAMQPDFNFYNNALETFIGLSKENLLRFCKLQVEESMGLLKSDDIFSGKKYIPSLYIKREKEEKELRELIQNEENNLIFVTGSPQHGKTSFICKFVEDLLQEGQFCLFYPAINIQNSLLDEIESDFNWILSENSSIHRMMTQKIQNILESQNSKLFIFLDGLNETGLEFISKLNKEFSRLKNLNITFILSFTNITARRLFIDEVNNVTELANHLSLSIKHIEALEIDSKNIMKNIINIPPYNNHEAIEAFDRYATVYNVEAKTKKTVYDPFLLRIIMHYYKDDIFYGNIDEVELLRLYIKEKSLRTKGLDELTIENILESISNDIYQYDSPIPFKNIFTFTSKEQIDPLFESAVLSKTYKNANHFLEFYNEREQCYYISMMRKWDEKLKNYDSFLLEIDSILKTNAGNLALSWYFKVNPFIIKDYWKDLFSNNQYSEIQSIFLKSLRLFLINYDDEIEEWFVKLLELGLHSDTKKIKVESLKLLHFFPDLKNEILDSDYENEENQLLFEDILFDENDELGYDPFDLINYETLKFLHHEEGASLIDDSNITIALKKIIMKKHNKKALEALAFCAPNNLIIFLDEEYSALRNVVNETSSLGKIIQEETDDFYYGHYMGCPGFFDNADQEELLNEYMEHFNYYSRFSKYYNNQCLLRYFQNLLEVIYSYLNEESIQILIDKGYIPKSEEDNIILDNPNQLYIVFD